MSSVSEKLSGNVKVKIKQGKTTLKTVEVHNTATSNLLYGMLLGLSGEYDSNKLPKYIGVGIGTTTDNVFNYQRLINETTLARTLITPNYKGGPKIDLSIHKVSVIYQGIVPSEDMSSQIINEIGLFGTKEGDTLLARIQLESETTISSGQSLVVEWGFTLENA